MEFKASHTAIQKGGRSIFNIVLWANSDVCRLKRTKWNQTWLTTVNECPHSAPHNIPDFPLPSGLRLLGYDGPLSVSWGGMYTNVGQQYLDVSKKFDKERGTNTADGENVDPNDLTTVNKYAVSSSLTFSCNETYDLDRLLDLPCRDGKSTHVTSYHRSPG